MNEPLLCWIGLLLVTLWKWATSTEYGMKMLRRRVAPHLRGHSWLVEWYSIAISLLGLFLMRTLYDVFVFDYWKDHFLTASGLQDALPGDAKYKDGLELQPWLRVAAVVMPFVGFVCFIVNVIHVFYFVRRQKVQREQEETMAAAAGEESSPWHLDKWATLTLLVIMTPAVFVVMAMRAQIRILQVFLGTSFHQGDDWRSYKLWRTETYDMDLQCAAAFQYLTVAAFVRLVSQFFNMGDLIQAVEEITEMRPTELHTRLKRHETQPVETQSVQASLRRSLKVEEDKQHYALTFAGMQGMWSYIIVGFARCILGIVMACLQELEDSSHWARAALDSLNKWAVEAQFKPVFVFTAVLCVYNWGIIQKLQDIKRDDAFGKSATLKFMGVRLLLLLGDMQKAALQGHVGKVLLGLSAYQGDLLHAILLLFECALVVAWNMLMWHCQAVRQRRRGPGVASREAGSGLGAALLPSV